MALPAEAAAAAAARAASARQVLDGDAPAIRGHSVGAAVAGSGSAVRLVGSIVTIFLAPLRCWSPPAFAACWTLPRGPAALSCELAARSLWMSVGGAVYRVCVSARLTPRRHHTKPGASPGRVWQIF